MDSTEPLVQNEHYPLETNTEVEYRYLEGDQSDQALIAGEIDGGSGIGSGWDIRE